MKTITVSQIPVNGEIVINIGQPCNGFIGLAEITLPFYELKGSDVQGYQLDIVCKDIDCCLLNPERLLRRILLPKPNWKKSFFKTIEFRNILFQQIDSCERKITIQLLDETGAPFAFPKDMFYNKVTVTLAMTNQNNEKSWLFR